MARLAPRSPLSLCERAEVVRVSVAATGWCSDGRRERLGTPDDNYHRHHARWPLHPGAAGNITGNSPAPHDVGAAALGSLQGQLLGAATRRVILSSPRSPAVPSRATSLLQSVLAKLVMVPENINYHAGQRPCDCIVFALQAERVLTRLPYPTFAERAHA